MNPDRLTLEPAIGESVTMELNELEDLGMSDNKTLDTFAGKAVHRVRFMAPDLRHTMLSLGRVHGVSEVTLNGKPLGVRWWGTEHLYNATRALKAGENDLEACVTTVLSNYCRTLKDNKMVMNWAGGHKQVSTGLVGPVLLFGKADASGDR